MADPELAGVFRQPFAEQVAFFRQKLGNLVPTATWRDLMGAQHDRAFMVAGAAKADLLADLAAAVDKAISDGEGLEAFRVRFGEIVERHGWQGWTGSQSARGIAWRTRVIYRTNAATSYAAGRYAQLAEFPLWVYQHGGSRDPRPQHLAWDGLTLPREHPFWQTHAPPNGWGCSCTVAGARSAAGARRLGGDPDLQLPDGWDDRDGDGRLPGIDEGWDYRPGATVDDQVRTLAAKLDRLPPQPSIDLIQSWIKDDAFARWFDAPKGAWPLVRLPGADARTIGAQEGVAVASLSAETVAKQKRRHPEITPAEYAAAQAVIDDPTNKVVDGRSLIYIREIDGANAGGEVLVVKATQTGAALWVTSYRRLSREQAERDSEVRRLLRKG